MEKYQVFVDVDPGPVVVELAMNLIKDIPTIDTIRFVAWDDITKDNIGVYLPDKKEVMIDLGSILNNADLYRHGMHYIPAVYFTTLWALFHEVIHGKQVEKEPQLAKLHRLPEDYEIAAQVATKDDIRIWAENNTIPPLNEWGWLGEQITELINTQYAKGEMHLVDELDLLKVGAVATADHVRALYEFSDSELMYAEIDGGHMGLKIEDVRYLTADDFFGLDRTHETVARTSQTVFMG